RMTAGKGIGNREQGTGNSRQAWLQADPRSDATWFDRRSVAAVAAFPRQTYVLRPTERAVAGCSLFPVPCSLFPMVRRGLVVQPQDVRTEIVGAIPPDGMDVVRSILDVIVLDEEGGALDPVVVGL